MTRPVTRSAQRSLHCPCGRAKIVARGLCGSATRCAGRTGATSAGLREAVLARDGRCCRVCHTPERGKRSLAVHHRVPGRSELGLMLTLCPGCHAKVTRTAVLRADWQPLLRTLWREQHPRAHEQGRLDFRIPMPVPVPATALLFASGEEEN